MRSGPLAGAAYFFRGLSLICRPGLRRYVLAPLAVNCLGLTALVLWGWSILEAQMAGLQDWLPDWLDWLSWLLVPLFLAGMLVAVFLGFILLANLIAAPFNGLLAAAVEERLGGTGGGSGGSFAREIARTLRSEMRKLAYFLPRALPLLAASLIPGVNVVATPLWLLLSTWMLTLEYADFPMGNHGIDFSEQRRIVARARMTALGFGAMVTLASMIPLLNFLAIPAAVAGATALWVDHYRPIRERS